MSEKPAPPVEPDEHAAETEDAPEPQTDADAAAEAAEPELPKPEVTIEPLGPCRRKIHLLATPETIEAHRDAKYKEISSKAQVPGFRPGRAPRRLLVKRFGKDLDDDIKRELVVAGFEKAVEEEDLQIVGQPDMNIEKLELPEEGPMTFDIEIEVKPDFELPAYRGIPLEGQDTEVTDAEVAEQIEDLRRRVAMGHSAFEPVTRGGVAGEDLVTAEVVGTLAEGGEEFYRDEQRSMIVAPGMLILHPTRDEVEALAGATVGETRTVKGHVGPRHENVEIRGQEAAFAVTVKEIKRLTLPDLDDAFAKEIGAEGVDDLKHRVRENAGQMKADRAREAGREGVRSWLLANTTLDLPAETTERQKERSLLRRKIRLMQRGVPEAVIAEQEEELKKAVDDQVEHDLKLHFIVDRIAAAEGIEISEEEINGIVSAIAKQTNRRFARLREEMDQDGRLDLLAADVLERKVLDELVTSADFTGAESAESPEKKNTTEAAEADEAREPEA